MDVHSPQHNAEDWVFQAELRPNRSANLKIVHQVMLLVALIMLPAGVVFVIAGAWPISGFMGAEAILLYLAFRLNLRDARLAEYISLSSETLQVERVDPWGRRKSWTFQPQWLHVAMDDPPKHESRLELRSHGKQLVIGRFLTPVERLEVAEAIRGALAQVRGHNPSAALAR